MQRRFKTFVQSTLSRLEAAPTDTHDTKEKWANRVMSCFKISGFILGAVCVLMLITWFDWWSSGDSRSNPREATWIHPNAPAPPKFVTPPYKSLEKFRETNRGCELYDEDDQWSIGRFVVHNHSFYYQSYADKVFMSVDWMVKVMNTTSYRSDVLCTFMFGGWPLAKALPPCLCVFKDFPDTMISPQSIVKLNATVQVQGRDDFWAGGKSQKYEVPKTIVTHWFNLTEAPLATGYANTCKESGRKTSVTYYSYLMSSIIFHQKHVSQNIRFNFFAMEAQKLYNLTRG